jgi:hypothetical protein
MAATYFDNLPLPKGDWTDPSGVQFVQWCALLHWMAFGYVNRREVAAWTR